MSNQGQLSVPPKQLARPSSTKQLSVEHNSVTNAESLRAIASGLESKSEIENAFLLLANKSETEISSKSSCVELIGRGNKNARSTWTDTDHLQYIEEFKAEALSLIRRFNTLRLEIIPCAISESTSVKRASVFERLFDISFKLTDSKKLEQVSSRAIKMFNRLLPDELKIPQNLDLRSEHSEALYSIAANLKNASNRTKQELELSRSLLERINFETRKLSEMLNAPQFLFVDCNPIVSHKALLDNCWIAYRSLLKETAELRDLSDWCSPTYKASINHQRGATQRPTPFETDYTRWGSVKCGNLERRLHRDIFRETTSEQNAQSLLLANGMAALSLAFATVASTFGSFDRQDKKSGQEKILVSNSMYFELNNLVEEWVKTHKVKSIPVDATNTEELVSKVRKNFPSVVVLESCSNSADLRVTEVINFLRSLCDRDWRAMATAHYQEGVRYLNIVIDNTLAGPSARWKQCNFELLPKFVRIFSAESLIKHAQDGQDLTFGGLLTCIGHNAKHDAYRVSRTMGIRPDPVSIARIELAHSPISFRENWERRGRNHILLAETVQNDLFPLDFLSRVVSPVLKNHPDYKATKQELLKAIPILNLELNLKNLRDLAFRPSIENGLYFSRAEFKHFLEDVAQVYNKLLLLLAREAGIDLYSGTSFGFHKTRIAVYERLATKEEIKTYDLSRVPYLRVAVGLENIKEIRQIALLMLKCNSILTRSITEHTLATLISGFKSERNEESWRSRTMPFSNQMFWKDL